MTTATKRKTNLDSALREFTSTDHYYTHFIRNPSTGKPFVYTDGWQIPRREVRRLLDA